MSSENVDAVSNAAPVAPSIIIQQPQNMTSNSPATIYWHSTAPENDPYVLNVFLLLPGELTTGIALSFRSC